MIHKIKNELVTLMSNNAFEIAKIEIDAQDRTEFLLSQNEHLKAILDSLDDIKTSDSGTFFDDLNALSRLKKDADNKKDK